MIRIRVLLRRTEALKNPRADEERILNEGSLKLDLVRIETEWKGAPVELNLTEFWIVQLLASQPGRPFSRSELMNAPVNADPRWNNRDRNVVLEDASVTQQIKRVRARFITVDQDFDAIQTVYGRGYRWISG